MNKIKACLRAGILLLVAALALSPALVATTATAATPCQSATAKLAQSQHALRVARSKLASQKRAYAKAKRKHQKAKARKLRKAVSKQSRVVNVRAAQVRRNSSARATACKPKPTTQPPSGNPPAQPQGTQQTDQLGTLLRLIGSIGGGTPTPLANITELQALLNGFQAGLGDQFSTDQLTSMLGGYSSQVPLDPATVAGLLGTQWDASQITTLLAASPASSLIDQVVSTVAVLLDTLAGSGFTAPTTLDPTVLNSLIGGLIGGGGGGIITLPCIPLLTC